MFQYSKFRTLKMRPVCYFYYLLFSWILFVSADDIRTATVDIDSQNLQRTAFPTPLNQTNATEPMIMTNIGHSLQICTTTNAQTGITIFGGPLNSTYWLYCLYINYNDSESGTSGIWYEGRGAPVTAASYWVRNDFSNMRDATANPYGVFVLLKPIELIQNSNDSFDAQVQNVNRTYNATTVSSDDVLQFYGIDGQLDYYYVCTTLSEFISTSSGNQNTTSVWYEITVVTPSWYKASMAQDTYYKLVTLQLENALSSNSSTSTSDYYTLPDTDDVYYAWNQPMMSSAPVGSTS